MRTIKFRAWDKEKKEMREVRDLSWDSHGGIDVGFACDEICEYRGSSDALMQFTGLLDKNGKEVYDGDIVQKISRSKDNYRRGSIFVVSWWDSRGVWGLANPISRCFNSPDLLSDANIEVIGNIHENPDLLK